MDHNVRVCQHLCCQVLPKTNIDVVKDEYQSTLTAQLNGHIYIYIYVCILDGNSNSINDATNALVRRQYRAKLNRRRRRRREKREEMRKKRITVYLMR